jgi:predicted phosphodiesterase
MTRVAVLADIHGNLPALEAVIDDLDHLAPDHVIVAGDVVNRGPQSIECLAAIRSFGWPMVYGNHEDYVLKFDTGDVPAEWYTDWWLPTRSVAEALTPDDKTYLRSLPWAWVVDEPGLPAIRVVHGSPRRLNEGLGFWMTKAELLESVQGVPESVIVGAHTHRPFEARVADRWILNCGALGAPFNGDPAAQYVLLTESNHTWEAEFRSIPYDHAPLYEAWERGGHLQRSMIAQVFKYEVETATFHLMSYMDFCDAHGLDVNTLASFEWYRRASADVVPGRSMKNKPEHE